MAIIPQDPVLFSGTVRSQLDPFTEYSDAEIWEVLEQVLMRDHVRGMSGGLLAEVSESGDNLSQGQRQLLCIARALLRKCRILVMDEATSAIDPATDAAIQRILKDSSVLHGTTVLTIAHRLQTCEDYDLIMTLSDGKVIEFDSPKVLLSNQNSAFYKMYHGK
jgi:ATP-binding cassette subfamily C (CFTR/MRP) protein 5